MKKLIVDQKRLFKEERWDFDFHSPPILVNNFPKDFLKAIGEVAAIVKDKKDPTKEPSLLFEYIDISSIDVETGEIARTTELTGEEAPSRARKLVQAYDIIISTCRPTRRAIAVVPESLHGQICSTGFSVIRASAAINPFYLHFALRLDSTMEQFRKFSTGSSYPAILDNDVEKTIIPVPSLEIQNQIVKRIKIALQERTEIIEKADREWERTVDGTIDEIAKSAFDFKDVAKKNTKIIWNKDDISCRIDALPKIVADEKDEKDQEQLLIEFS